MSHARSLKSYPTTFPRTSAVGQQPLPVPQHPRLRDEPRRDWEPPRTPVRHSRPDRSGARRQTSNSVAAQPLNGNDHSACRQEDKGPAPSHQPRREFEMLNASALPSILAEKGPCTRDRLMSLLCGKWLLGSCQVNLAGPSVPISCGDLLGIRDYPALLPCIATRRLCISRRPGWTGIPKYCNTR